MRKSLFTLLVVCCFGLLAAAQDSTAGSSQSTTTTQTTTTTTASPSTTDQSSQSATMPQDQSATSNGATQTSNGDQVVEGCLVKETAGYFIQPANGGARTQLSPSRSLDSYVGQDIQVSGSNGSSAAGSPTSTTGSDQNAPLVVTHIKTVATTCGPISQTSPSQNTQPPQQ